MVTGPGSSRGRVDCGLSWPRVGNGIPPSSQYCQGAARIWPSPTMALQALCVTAARVGEVGLSALDIRLDLGGKLEIFFYYFIIIIII